MINVTLIPGDGIGPEVINSTKEIIDRSGVKINWEIVNCGEGVISQFNTPLPDHVLQSIIKNKIALEGPVTTPVGGGFRSVNVTLRKEFDLYANVRPIKKIEGIVSKFDNVDMVIVRENTEDLYAGIEYMINPDIAQSIKVITRKGSERIVRYAFEYTRKLNRKKVTCVHKANIMKLSDGLFLNVAREIATEYPDILFTDEIVDALCMNLVLYPENYDVLVLPNLYGDIVSDLSAAFVGGLGVVPGSNIGTDIAIFEPAHGSAPTIAGQNIANPIAAILSGCMMLKHLGEITSAARIEKAVESVVIEGKVLTKDLGGSSFTTDFTRAVIEVL